MVAYHAVLSCCTLFVLNHLNFNLKLNFLSMNALQLLYNFVLIILRYIQYLVIVIFMKLIFCYMYFASKSTCAMPTIFLRLKAGLELMWCSQTCHIATRSAYNARQNIRIEKNSIVIRLYGTSISHNMTQCGCTASILNKPCSLKILKKIQKKIHKIKAIQQKLWQC